MHLASSGPNGLPSHRMHKPTPTVSMGLSAGAHARRRVRPPRHQGATESAEREHPQSEIETDRAVVVRIDCKGDLHAK